MPISWYLSATQAISPKSPRQEIKMQGGKNAGQPADSFSTANFSAYFSSENDTGRESPDGTY